MATKFLFASGNYLPDGDKPLGSGRYGEVWAVRSETGNHRRAVKINSPKHRDVLQKEFETLKELENFDDENLILRAYEMGETDDRRPCMLMDLIEAKPLRTLAQELRKRLILPGSQQMEWALEDEILRVRVATQIANALYKAFKARIALTDLKIDNFYYDENWPQLIKVIDWNFVDTETPHAGFINDTIPKLGDVFYEIFTGLSLREQEQEDRIGKINVDLFAKMRREQTWPMFWDQITFGTREIIQDMVFTNFKGENQPYNLWSRWLARRRLLVEKDGLDKIFAIEAADLAGKLDLTPDLELIEAYSILRLINKNEQREARLREITHRYISGLVGDRDFHRSEVSLLSARRSYTGSIRLDFWLLFTQLGLTADSEAVYADQIQDLPRRMEEYWHMGEFDALRNMLERISDKVNNYWTIPNQEIKRLIEHLFLTINFLQRIRQAEDLLFEDARTNNKWLPNFSHSSLKIISDLKESTWVFGYLQDTAHLSPRYDIVVGQLRELLRKINDLRQGENTNLELGLYTYILKSSWHNILIVDLFEKKINFLKDKIQESVTDYGVKLIESKIENNNKKIWDLYDKVIGALPILDQVDKILKDIDKTNDYLNTKIDEDIKRLNELKLSVENNLRPQTAILENSQVSLSMQVNGTELSTKELVGRVTTLNTRKENLEIQVAEIKEAIDSIKALQTLGLEEKIKELEDKFKSSKLMERLKFLSDFRKDVSTQRHMIEEEFPKVANIVSAWEPHREELLNEVKTVNRKTNEILTKSKDIVDKQRVIEPYLPQIQVIEKSQQSLLEKLKNLSMNFVNIETDLSAFEGKLTDAERRIESAADRFRKDQRRIGLLITRYKRVKRYLSAFNWRFWTRLAPLSKSKKAEDANVKDKFPFRNWRYAIIPLIIIIATIVFLPHIPNYQISIPIFSIKTKTETPTLLPTDTQKITSTENVSLTSPVASSTEISPTQTPVATIAITPTPEKVMATISKISTTLKGEPSEGSFNAQQFSDALTFNPSDQLEVIGKNKDNNWLLLYRSDSNGVWLGWADINWLNPLTAEQLEGLPLVVSCNFVTSGLPFLDEPDGKQLIETSRRYIVYLVVETQDIWVKIDGGPGGGWVKKDMIKCSGDISANSVAP